MDYAKKIFGQDWKTTATGFVMLVLIGLHYVGVNIPGLAIPSDPGAQIMMILSALGLINAADAPKNS